MLSLRVSLSADYNDYANPLVCAFFVALTPVWVLIARRIPSTKEVLYSGWEPVIIAMAISRWVSTPPGQHRSYLPVHLSIHIISIWPSLPVCQ